MDYEKKYKEALVKLKEHFTPTSDGIIAGISRELIEDIFPELRESEDEDIRKQIISFLKEFERDHYRNLDFSSWIAWLEKQGEKPIGICSGHATGKLGEIIKDIKAEPFDKYESLTDFERTLADICIGWIGQEYGWKQYIKDNADALLKIAIEKFNSVQDATFEQKPANEEMKDLLHTEYEKGRADAISEMKKQGLQSVKMKIGSNPLDKE